MKSYYTHILEKKPSQCFFADRVYLADEVDAYIKKLLQNVTAREPKSRGGIQPPPPR